MKRSNAYISHSEECLQRDSLQFSCKPPALQIIQVIFKLQILPLHFWLFFATAYSQDSLNFYVYEWMTILCQILWIKM